MVLRHKLVFSVGEVDRYDGQIVCVEFPHQPFQRHGVPYNNALIGCTDMLDGLLHVVVGFNLLSPSFVLDQVVTETALMDDDGVARQTLTRLNVDDTVLRHDDTVCEQLYDASSIGRIATREVGIHSQHQV